MEKIKHGTVRMCPRWQFILQTSLVVVGLLLSGFSAIYVVSLVVFLMQERGTWWLSSFGGDGMIFTITTLPWMVVGLALLFMGILALLVRHFAWSYRHPLVLSLGGLTAFVLIGAATFHTFMVHDHLRTVSERPHFSGLRHIYPLQHQPPRGVVIGTITRQGLTELVLTTSTGDELIVVITPTTKLPPQPLMVGSAVLVFGDTTDHEASIVVAKGIRPLPPRLEKQVPPPQPTDATERTPEQRRKHFGE